MEQYADEFERQCAALRSRLATEENKSRHLEAERDALRERCDGLESDANCERSKRKCAEGRTQEMKMAIARYLAEKKQPGSDRRAEYAALASLHAIAATEAKDCPECDGAGQQINMAPGPLCGAMRICPACEGTGVKQGASK